MVGYWNKPEQTAAALVDGWYRSGDLGYMDDDGYVYLVDRAKDMIVTGGENVYCTEVEDVLYRHPAVLEAAVFGVPDERWGEAVHAVVVPRAEVTRRRADRATAASAIAGYKVPKRIELRTRAAAEVRRRQGAQARAARAVLGGPGHPGRGHVTGVVDGTRQPRLGEDIEAIYDALTDGRHAVAAGGRARLRRGRAVSRAGAHPGRDRRGARTAAEGQARAWRSPRATSSPTCSPIRAPGRT